MADHTRGAAKDVRELLKQLAAQRFTFKKTKSCNFAIFGPNGQHVVVLAAASGDWRALRNSIARLRAAGFTHPR